MKGLKWSLVILISTCCGFLLGGMSIYFGFGAPGLISPLFCKTTMSNFSDCTNCSEEAEKDRFDGSIGKIKKEVVYINRTMIRNSTVFVEQECPPPITCPPPVICPPVSTCLPVPAYVYSCERDCSNRCATRAGNHVNHCIHQTPTSKFNCASNCISRCALLGGSGPGGRGLCRALVIGPRVKSS